MFLIYAIYTHTHTHELCEKFNFNCNVCTWCYYFDRKLVVLTLSRKVGKTRGTCSFIHTMIMQVATVCRLSNVQHCEFTMYSA